MDSQLNLIWSMNKDENSIVYPHNGETVIYRKQKNTETDTDELYEFRTDESTGVTKGRKLNPVEMTVDQFDMLKPILDEDTKRWFRKEKNQTRLNVCFDAIEETDLACVPSPETEMMDSIEQQESEIRKAHDPLRRTRENAEAIMEACLTPLQKSRFIAHYRDGKSSYEIADEEDKNHKSILESIEAAEKRIKKRKIFLTESQNTPLKRHPKVYR